MTTTSSQAAHTLPQPRAPLEEAPNRANAQVDSPIETVDLTKSSENASSAPPSQPTQAGTQGGSKGTKRKAIPDVPNEQDVDLSGIDVDGLPIKHNANQVRQMIRRLIDNGGMKVGEFCNTIEVSNNAYNRFMQQSGATKGFQSDVFMNASAYFTKRDIAGLKLPTAQSKKAKTSSGDKSGSKGSGSNDMKFLEMELPGEANDNVPIYDTCSDIRTKISAYLRSPGVTQAQFCRDLHSQMHTPAKGVSVSSNTLQSFRSKELANEGGDNKVFYAAYVFFEKKRLAEGKHKSKKRQEMEEVWPRGVDRNIYGRTRMTCAMGDVPYVDKYGKPHIRKRFPRVPGR